MSSVSLRTRVSKLLAFRNLVPQSSAGMDQHSSIDYTEVRSYNNLNQPRMWTMVIALSAVNEVQVENLNKQRTRQGGVSF